MPFEGRDFSAVAHVNAKVAAFGVLERLGKGLAGLGVDSAFHEEINNEGVAGPADVFKIHAVRLGPVFNQELYQLEVRVSHRCLEYVVAVLLGYTLLEQELDHAMEAGGDGDFEW